MNPFAIFELDAANYPELRDGIVRYGAEHPGETFEPRSYPGYPRWPLDKVRPTRWGSLEKSLTRRRSATTLSAEMPSRSILSRVLGLSHGISGNNHFGPTPSAGGLQALELYVVACEPGWLPAGVYHYDRAGHHLSQLAPQATRDDWKTRVPSLELVQGGSLLWILAGDAERVSRKYGERTSRFLLLEAGHLMQNLCLMSASQGCVTLPLGGFFERDIARALQLAKMDLVLYAGVFGRVEA